MTTAADDVDRLFRMNAISFAVQSVTREGANLCLEKNKELGEIFDSNGQRKTRSGASMLRTFTAYRFWFTPRMPLCRLCHEACHQASFVGVL